MILTFLLGALVAAAIFQPTASRFIAAVVFVSGSWLHELAFCDVEGFAYHSTAALIALIIIIANSRLANLSPVILTIQRVCIASMLLNFIGWAAWRAYLPPEPYNVAMTIVFIWALVALIRKESADVGSGSMDVWSACIRRNGVASY